jgi:putative transposase
MIGLEDRQALAQGIEAAQYAGARLEQACEVAGIDLRSLQRWKANQGLVSGDDSADAVRPTPAPRADPSRARANPAGGH